jgi:hypothetical protein
LVQCVVNIAACCSYGDWQNIGCNELNCSLSDMSQVRTAQTGCPDE